MVGYVVCAPFPTEHHFHKYQMTIIILTTLFPLSLLVLQRIAVNFEIGWEFSGLITTQMVTQVGDVLACGMHPILRRADRKSFSALVFSLAYCQQNPIMSHLIALAVFYSNLICRLCNCSGCFPFQKSMISQRLTK